MSGTELKNAKREIRRRVLALRDAMPTDERERRTRLLTQRFLGLPEVRDAGTIMGFWSFGSEPSTPPLLETLHGRGCRVALPRIVAGEVEARVWAPGDPMSIASFGALEPAAGTTLGPDDVDLVATPAVAFDRTGGRIGYGGGFYDRFLSLTRDDAVRVGIGFDVQLLDEELPGGSFDLRVDLVVTESQTVRCRGRR